ncbi:MDR family MFS transporter [Brevibacillus dissolubilis]|uniref:MDR family MFS transporter n=1 Tax=Brevibacillus dissolubilis TaxID=1844116 RepID=UPI00159BD903|nr:MFS transporter [Brevibacillus dissolubilis]
MKRLFQVFNQYDDAIWVRVCGTFLTKIAQFMMYPFLVLYMTEKFDSPVTVVTAIIGLESIAGFLINLFLGGLSDRVGRKLTMMVSLAVQAICLTGFIFADSLWLFAVLIVILGAGSYIFFPAADAQIADSVPVEKRAKVYAMLGTAASLGIAVGPIIGLFTFQANPDFVFLFFACVSFLYLALVWWKIPETLPVLSDHTENRKQANIYKISVRKHKHLFLITLLAIPTSLFATQDWSTFPLYLKEQAPQHYDWMYSSLLSIGAAASATLQIWIATLVEKRSASRAVLIGYMIAASAALGYAFFIHYGVLVAVRVISVVGNTLYNIHLDKFISVYAPADMRGRYFSIFGLHWRVSEALGPFLGGVLLTAFSGRVMYIIFALLLIVSGLVLSRMMEQLKDSTAKPANTATE